MEFFSEASLMAFFTPYAFQPTYVYSFIFLFMLASSIGLPIPEELVLISAGLVAYAAHSPDTIPPYPGAASVDVYTLCAVCFLSVLFSDCMVYFIGKIFGGRIIKTEFFQKRFAGAGFDKINSWFQKYGGWACGIFRFTPGLRFPGHLSCGLLGIPVWKFVLIDVAVAAISVPTQVYLVATYGDVILDKLSTYKMILASAFLVFIVVWLVRRFYLKKAANKPA